MLAQLHKSVGQIAGRHGVIDAVAAATLHGPDNSRRAEGTSKVNDCPNECSRLGPCRLIWQTEMQALLDPTSAGAHGRQCQAVVTKNGAQILGVHRIRRQWKYL